MSIEHIKPFSKENGSGFTLTLEMLRKIVRLKELEKAESEQISKMYRADSNAKTVTEALKQWQDEQTGKISRPAYKELESYLRSLSMENIVFHFFSNVSVNIQGCRRGRLWRH